MAWVKRNSPAEIAKAGGGGGGGVRWRSANGRADGPRVGGVPAVGVGPEDAGSTERAAEEAVAAGDRQMRCKAVARRLGTRPVAEGHRKRLVVVPVVAGDAL